MNKEIIEEFLNKEVGKAKKTPNKAINWERARKIRNEVNAQVGKAKADHIETNLQVHAGPIRSGRVSKRSF